MSPGAIATTLMNMKMTLVHNCMNLNDVSLGIYSRGCGGLGNKGRPLKRPMIAGAPECQHWH